MAKYKVGTHHEKELILGRGESVRSKAPKVDVPGSKWTVQNTKVDGPQRMKLDGPKMRVRSRTGESGRSSKCLDGQKGVKVDGLNICAW